MALPGAGPAELPCFGTPDNLHYTCRDGVHAERCPAYYQGCVDHWKANHDGQVKLKRQGNQRIGTLRHAMVKIVQFHKFRPSAELEATIRIAEEALALGMPQEEPAKE